MYGANTGARTVQDAWVRSKRAWSVPGARFVRVGGSSRDDFALVWQDTSNLGVGTRKWLTVRGGGERAKRDRLEGGKRRARTGEGCDRDRLRSLNKIAHALRDVTWGAMNSIMTGGMGRVQRPFVV